MLGNDALVNMRYRADIVSEFPFFRVSIPPEPSRCGSCKKKDAPSRQNYEIVVNGLKNAILALPAERLARFKALLGVDRLVLYARGARGVEKHDI